MSDAFSADSASLHLTHFESGPPAADPEIASRRQPRLKLPPMYTLVRARLAGAAKYRWTGHIYDISASGMRFELDQPLDMGTTLEVRGMLPGSHHTTFRATGRVVRLHDDADDSQGPVRMGMHFDRFETESDARRLSNYLTDRGLAA